MKLLLFTLSFNLLFAYSQTGCFPTEKSSGRIVYSGEIEYEDMTKDQIFDHVLYWGIDYENSQFNNQSTKNKDVGIYRIYVKLDYKYKEWIRDISFNVTIKIKGNKLQYKFDDFIMNDKKMITFYKEKEGDDYYFYAFKDICRSINKMIVNLEWVEE